MHERARTSWRLIRGAADGDDQARTRFVATYARTIRGALRARWRNGPLAHSVDDAMQDIFVECLKAGGVLHKAHPADGHGFRVYLASVVRNVARRVEERFAEDRRRRADDAFDGDGVPAAWTTVSQAIDRDWARAIVAEATREQQIRAEQVGGHAPRRFELLRLRFVDGLTIADIAALWKLEPAYVHHQYAKARDDFRRALSAVLARRSNGGSPRSTRARFDQIVDLLGPPPEGS